MVGLGFGILTLGLNHAAHGYPEWMERWYSRGLFPVVRLMFDRTTGRLPVPAFYLFWAGVVLYWLFKYLNRPLQIGFWPACRYWFARLAGFSGWLLALFYWLWGFNYARLPFEKQIGLTIQPLDSAVLWQDLRAETRVLDSLRRRLVGPDTNAVEDTRFWPPNAEDSVREAVKSWLIAEHFPAPGRVRGRIIYPEGTLFKFGASGIYWPFAGEGNVEAGLHALRKLPAMAHEMSHGYGVSDEGVCNFIAYAACSGHSRPYLAYCARLDYWATLARTCRMLNPDAYKTQFLPEVPVGILNDQRAIRRQNARFREFAPELRYHVYDNYLKAQGISAGMLNYDQVLVLVRAWKMRGG